MFNSLKYAKILESAGLPRKQAETHIQILSDVIGEGMASKEDIRAVTSEVAGVKAIIATQDDIMTIRAEMATQEDIKAIRAEMATQDDIKAIRAEMATQEDIKAIRAEMATQDDIKRLETKMHYELRNLEQKMVLKLGGMMAAFLATGLTATKLLFF